MKREENLESVGDVLKNMVGKYNLQEGLDDAAVKELWEEFLGPELRVHTKWMRIKEGVLYAQFHNSTARHEVFLQRSKLKDFINEGLGEEKIREVRLV